MFDNVSVSAQFSVCFAVSDKFHGNHDGHAIGAKSTQFFPAIMIMIKTIKINIMIMIKIKTMKMDTILIQVIKMILWGKCIQYTHIDCNRQSSRFMLTSHICIICWIECGSG